MTEIFADRDTLEQQFETDEQTSQESAHYVHIINPVDNMHVQQLMGRALSSKEIAQIAKEMRIEVKCLCGYIFVPSRSPEVVNDTCDTCLAIAGELMRGAGE